MLGWRRWKNGSLIPDQHEPGVQKGFHGSAKTKKKMGSEHHSNSTGSVIFWPVGKWAGGYVDGRKGK